MIGLEQILTVFLEGIQFKETLPAKQNRLKDQRVSITRETADPIELAARGEVNMASLTQISRSSQTAGFLLFLICSMRGADPDIKAALHISFVYA